MKQKPVPSFLQPFLDGKLLLIDKPLKWTSFDVVNKIRVLTQVKKVGHAGTLDPLATGLLIICTGKFTKMINEYMGQEKEYTGTITVGATTPTFDLESNPENIKSYSHLTEQQIIAATIPFIGEIQQMPPIHSALKQQGKPVYLAARLGEEVILNARPVTIKSFEITNIELPNIAFKVVCSTGTYIRSLANDFGELLGTGGYLSSLCRTRIGTFELKNAQSLPDFENNIIQLSQQLEGQTNA